MNSASGDMASLRMARVAVQAIPASTPAAARGWAQVEHIVMLATLVSLGVRTTVISAVPVGTAMSLSLAPLWLGVLRRFVGARLIFALGLSAVASGVWLAWDPFGRRVDVHSAVADCALVVGAISGVGVILWCRLHMSDVRVGTYFGLGLLLNAVVNPGELTPTNPWKFGYVLPVGVIALSLLNRPSRRWLQLVTLLMLSISCVLTDARSMGATFVLSAILVSWQLRPLSMSRHLSWIWTAVTLGCLGTGLYRLATAMLVEGYLGAEAQARSIEQLQSTGSLILGGRPEAAATLAMFPQNPLGYGVGIVPTMSDINLATNGMFQRLGYMPDAGYVQNFMFGGRIELHSTLADFWAHYGLAGLLFGLIVTFYVVRGAATRISRREASGLLLYLTWWTLWNILFSPAYSALPTLVLVLGLTLFQADIPHGRVPAGVPARRRDGAAEVEGNR